jgi:hypothetical protein
MPEPIEIEKLIADDVAAAKLGVKVNTLTAWRALGQGPPFVKIGRRVFYEDRDLATWLGTRRQQPTTAKSRRREAGVVVPA